MSELEYKNCFVCGKDNPVGLKLEFVYANNTAYCIWDTHKNYEGYPEIIHGGIIATLLDEVMAKAILGGNQEAVTTEMTVRYLKPARVNKRYKVFGEINNQRKKIIECSAYICDIDDEEYIIAKAVANYWQVKANTT
ncbi:MAG TPA: PaaI family thioesterase [Candidatus Cloacimonadota bacterium]|jgi:uncharacterized protein (TIGR00369 family)|nr:PaaI family thioesterase [Candidatus Cloacimonadales bacterium]HPY96402.1 PaaI family thioesterase [Candidatus Cloacimonadota bacterium]HQB41025.1 PaaI family thioesterase [Candidatus Cloacimonadota bacterium]